MSRRVLLVLLLTCGSTGCASWRHELEEERTSLQMRNAATQEYLARNAPVGSRWVTHTDTERLLGDINRTDGRIREIDRELRE